MFNNYQTVFIIDHDEQVRQSLVALMRSMDLDFDTFTSATEFLNVYDPMRSGCLVLEAYLPGMSGLELLERINNQVVYMPAIVISTRGDARTVVRAMRAGALDFLEKPCRDQLVKDAVLEALKWDAANRPRLNQIIKVDHRLERLTIGEYDVLEKIADGKSNKDIASDLGVSIRAIEARRAKLMRKMKAKSLADLMRMTMLADFPKSSGSMIQMGGKRLTAKIDSR
jgi:two-component system, LuxR family, response regulator FixJ